MDRHRLWRHVEHDLLQARRRAPEGYEPFVEVFLVGRDEPVELGFVETVPDPDYPYVRFEIANEVGTRPEGQLDQKDSWIHVHEAHVSRVEVSFRKIGTGSSVVGFGYGERPPDGPELQ